MQKNKENLVDKEKSQQRIQYAALRVRGKHHINVGIRRTLELLQLYRQNYCVIVEKTKSSEGMLRKVKDYITWGEANNEVMQKLRDKRLEHLIGKDGKKQEKKFFRLNPPRKGFERRGIKRSFKEGGVLGYRGEKINDLLLRMI